MDHIKSLIKNFSKLGVLIFVDDGQLKTRADKHVMTPDLIAVVKENKHQILEYFAQGFDVIDDDSGMPPRPLGALPLSFSQQRLWLMDQISGSGAHYNMPGVIKLSGKLDHMAVQKALICIVERHESLRTVFRVAENGEPALVIQDAASFQFGVIDLSSFPETDAQLKLAHLMEEESARVFDLSADFMLRAQLVQCAAEEHSLLVTLHHIASDGWSLAILVNEFCALYRAYSQGEGNPLTPLPIQYADYAYWQRNWLQGEVLNKQLGYWVTQLASLPVVHSLPLDRPRPSLQSFVGHIYSSHMDTAISNALNSLCQSQGATLFMGLHAAFSILLSRYSNETDIVVGSPIANREQAEVAGLIGFFVNTLVLRSDLSVNPNFIELLNQSKGILLDAYTYQQVPFEQIVEQLQPERSLSHSPLFQVMLVLQNNALGTLAIPDLTLSLVELNTDIAKYDLTLFVSESAQGLQLNWEYNTDIFDATTIVRMANHFELLLQSLLKSPSENVFNVDMLSSQERHQFLVEWNDTTVGYPRDKCIHELFQAQVENTPDAIAVIFESEQLTYQELNKKANQLAHYLLNEKHVTPDTLVGICVERSLEMVIGILAILKAGGAYVPLDPEYPEARLKYLLDDAKLTTVLTQRPLRATTPVTDEQAVFLDDENIQHQLRTQSTQNPKLNELGLTSSHLAYVIYTSGSTGNPKGVMIQHTNTVAFISWATTIFNRKQLDCVLASTSVCFDLSIFEIFLPLSVGGSFLIVNNILDLQRNEYPQEISLINTVPSAIEVLLVDNYIPKSIRTINLAGEPLKQKIVDRLYAEGIDLVYDLYGPSEDTTYSTFVLRTENGISSIGKAINNSQIYVLNKACQLVGNGIAGELHMGGVGLARGYLNRPDLTAEKFIPNPFYDKSNPSSSERLYKTGDLVRWLPDGNLVFLGRIDHQVKIRGFRIELGEIENTLAAYVDVKDVIVLAKESVATGDKQLIAYVVTDAVDVKDESELSATARHQLIENLRHHLNQTLPNYMVPSAFVLLDKLPLTPNGKVDRKALPEPDMSAQQNWYVAPRTETEKVLCEIWQDVLGVARVGIKDNFFQLGGDSLKLVRFLGAANKAKLPYTIANIMEYPNIDELIRAFSDMKKVPINQNLVDGEIPLSSAQQLFLKTTLDQPHWGNTTQYFDLVYFDKIICEQALLQVLTHHDALRAIFIKSPGGWKQIIKKPEHLNVSLMIDYIDFSQVPDNQKVDKIDQLIVMAQGEMNLQEAPLIKIKIFYLGKQKGYVGRVNVHHLLIDGYSSKILFEDWMDCYTALIAEKSFSLSHKTTSTSEWVNRLIDNINTPINTEQEINYWFNLPWDKAAKIPVDYPERLHENTTNSNIDIPLVVSQRHTDDLLNIAMKLGIPFVNLLITVLVKTLAVYAQSQWVPIRVLDAGRGLSLDLDVSRTIGWLSVQRTLMLDTQNDLLSLDVITFINQQIENIPNKGFGFELLQCYHKDKVLQHKLESLGKTELFLNFHGVLDSHKSEGAPPFSAILDKGIYRCPWIAPLNINNEKFSCNASVLDGQLSMTWRFSENLYDKNSMIVFTDQLLENFIAVSELKGSHTKIDQCQLVEG